MAFIRMLEWLHRVLGFGVSGLSSSMPLMSQGIRFGAERSVDNDLG